MSNYLKYILLLSIALILVSCSTKKNTGITRTYHNLTAHYNILFNGEESFKKGIDKLEETSDDDFTQLLPVFLYENKDAVKGISGEMDRAVKKMTKLISMHSLTVKPEIKSDKELNQKQKEFYNKREYNKYVDDAYLLMGKSHFYKQEYSLAKETFNYIISNFPESFTVFETKVWLARLANEEENYRESEDILEGLTINLELPKKLQGEIYATQTDLYIKQKQYPEAIESLKKAIENTPGKFLCMRYNYLLAQLYGLTEDFKLASQSYNKVIKMNPPYKMTFSAKINRALTYQSGSGSKKDIEKQLDKMLRDDKNIEFQDQIYYAIGSLYLRDKMVDKAIENFILSTQKSTDNQRQKARSSLTLADIYYAKPDYIHAQSYYDSAVAVIDKDYPDYQNIYAKSVSLTKLVENYRTVTFEDSVLKLAVLPNNDLLALVDGLIEKQIEAEEQQKFLDQQLLEERMLNSNDIGLQQAGAGGNWYFYNPTAKTMGRKEFFSVWGGRKLEDNWRRKNKNVVSFGEIPSEEEGEEDKIVKTAAGELVTNKRKREFYLQYIPFTDSAKAQSLIRIMNGLYNMGEIYSDELKDYPRGIESFEELLRRFPLYENKLQVYYKLYSVSKNTKDIDRVGKYQQSIIREYPNSNFAKLMTNPDYIKEIAAQEKKVYNYYDDTYMLFRSANYPQVIQRSENAMKEYPDHDLYPKFDYMRTISAGIKKDTLSFVNDLQGLVAKYPSTDIAENAQIMITYLQNKAPSIIEKQNLQIARDLYSASGDETHFFAYVVPSSVNMNQLIFNIVNFNLDNFDKLKLEVKRQNVSGKKGLCLVQEFNNGGEAMAYFTTITRNQEIFRDIDPSEIVPVLISQSNLSKLTESGKIDQYILFFNENYR